MKALAKHFDLQPSEIMQRYCFHTRFRQSGETVATYLSELRSLAQKCNFKANTLSEMLRDRLVCGINNEAIQRRLLSEVVEPERTMEVNPCSFTPGLEFSETIPQE